MSPTFTGFRSLKILISVLVTAAIFSSCKPDGFINKVKYDGEKYINTCTTFQEDIQKTLESNNDPNRLRVAEYDNSDFSYFYLESGQVEVIEDTLFFRLVKDLDYPKYLDKGVAVHVNASSQAAEGLASLEETASENLGTLVVDRAYYLKNRKPFFLYKFPLNGKSVAGKQLMLSFAIAKYDKKGNLKNFFCQTDEQPLGTAMPTCCAAKPWANTQLQTRVDMPELNVNGEKFKYDSFTGTIDVQFEESSFNLEDDSSFSAEAIQFYVNKYKGYEYALDRLDLTGYASPGGKETYNQKLSERRATSLKEGLMILNGDLEGLDIAAVGKGEDWERVKLLTKISTLDDDQQEEVLVICNDTTLTNDQKEAKLRKVPFWETLVEEVLIKARHTFAIMDFDYSGQVPTLKRYIERHPVASSDMEDVAKKVFDVKPYNGSMDGKEELEEVLAETASPNLYAMRATYHVANEDYQMAINDLEKASSFRGPASEDYNLAIQGYKVLFADNYTFDEKKSLYQELTTATSKDKSKKGLFYNRALVMEKMGYLSGALKEYGSLLDGEEPTAAQHLNRGVARMKANMLTEAEADFMAATTKDPQMGEAFFNLAAIYSYRGLTFKTIEYLDKAIAIDPGFKDYIFNNPIFSVLSEDPRFEKYR